MRAIADRAILQTWLHVTSNIADTPAPCPGTHSRHKKKRWLTRALRSGDTVLVTRLFLLAEPRVKTRDNPRADLWAVLRRLRKSGISVLELATGRVSTNCDQMADMLADAIEMLTYGGRGHPETAKINGAKGGRPPSAFTADELRQAETAWFDMRYKTNAEAVDAFPKRFTRERAYRKFGPSGRGST